MDTDSGNAIRDSLGALVRNFFLIIAMSVGGGVLAYGIAKHIPGSHHVHFSYMISMDQHEDTAGFRYDGYYALSAIELFSKTLANVASAPETIVAAHNRAGIELPTDDAIRLLRVVQAESSAPQLVQFTVRNESRKNAEALADGLQSVMNDTVDAYNEKGIDSISFRGVFTDRWTSYSSLNPVAVATTLFVSVFLLGILIVLFREAIARGSS